MIVAACAFAAGLAAPPIGGTLYSPRVEQVAPAGGQRGIEVVVAFVGQRLAEPQELMFTDVGIAVIGLRADKPERCEATLRILPDCPLGPHALRVRTAFGISNLVWFQVGALAELDEKRAGDAAMSIALEHTINASLRGEEIDRYALELQAGARVHCEVTAMRLGFSPVDLALSVVGPDGRSHARVDDTALGQKDPWVIFTADESGRVVLFGGDLGSDYYRADTWEWDGTVWLARSTSPKGGSVAMANDSTRQRVVLFTGNPADTWEWNGAVWLQRTPATSPPARTFTELAYDAARQRVVLFGGGNFGYVLADTWEWDGTSWTQRSPASSPTKRQSHAMAYDSARQRVVLQGGSDTNVIGYPCLRDTWEWDGTVWIKRSPGGPSAGTMAYDFARQRLVLFGNGPNTWLYGPITRATAQPIGVGCTGTKGPPLLTSNEPNLGNPAFLLDLLSARPASVCAFLLADRQQSLPLPGGCTVHVDGTLILLPALTNASGFATTSLAVPLDVALRGGAFYAQAMVIDPQGPVTGLAFSAGRKLVIGD